MKCFFLIIVVLVLGSFVPSNDGRLNFTVEPVFNTEPLKLSEKKYISERGDTLSIEAFRFYLSNFKIYVKGKCYPFKNSYFLVDAEKPESQKFFLTGLPDGKIDSVIFYTGVDSLANVSGALEGALDPMHGMFWAWNTGYIHAKLEGKSGSCKTLHQAFEFHIGGYLRPYNVSRKIKLVPDKYNPIIKIRADVAKWFNGKSKISLQTFNSVMRPCAEAVTMADNYKEMFALVE